VAEDLYEVGWTYTSGAAAHAIGEIIPGTLAAGTRIPEIRELGIFNVSGVAAELGMGRPAAIGVTPGTLVTDQSADSTNFIAGDTKVAASWGTAPTVPGTYMRRFELPAVVGAGVIFTWNQSEFKLWSGAAISTIVLWQISALAVTYDCYIKVAE
jgi:hypothetical protein